MSEDGLLHYLPPAHIKSLREKERTYWWCRGRTYWAMRTLDKLIGERSIGVYADVGCGTGFFAAQIRDRYQPRRTLLVDGDATLPLREPGFECLIQNFDAGIRFPEPAEVVTSMDVIEHIRDDTKMLFDLHSQMKPEGILVATVPAVPFFFSDWDRKLGHHRRYLKRDLADKFQAAGFDIVDLQYMWSFLAPMGPNRRLRRYKTAELPDTPKWLDEVLFGLSRIEWHVTRTIATLIGTSLFIAARRR